MGDSTSTQSCEICGEKKWVPVYRGPVRDGAFGSTTSKDHTVYHCGQCGVQRLEEPACKDDSFYAGKKYREMLGEASDAEGFGRTTMFIRFAISTFSGPIPFVIGWLLMLAVLPAVFWITSAHWPKSVWLLSPAKSTIPHCESAVTRCMTQSIRPSKIIKARLILPSV